MGTKLPLSFYRGSDTLSIARSLLGKLLVVPTDDGTRVSGMVVETEAYQGVDDRAAHSFGGRRTARNEIMYGRGGHVYVFFIYGMYYQFNVVVGQPDTPHAILIRGLEPVDGLDTMRERRPKAAKDHHLMSGPGKLCIAMNIDRTFNAELLTGDRVWLERYRNVSASAISAGPRVGIDYAGEDAAHPWRFWITGNPHVSKAR